MGEFGISVWDPPGIATFAKKIASVRPESASGTMYRFQSGRGTMTIKAGYDRLGDIITVDPSDHTNDVASLIRVHRGTDLIQELLVQESPNLVADQPAVLALDGIEAVMDWATVEAWDWDGSADFSSQVPDWIYGGRNLIPPLALGDLDSIREEWELYLSGERYELDVSLATSGDYLLTFDGNDTNPIDWDASHTTIKSELEALAGISTVSVLQPDPDTREFVLVFENPKDLPSNLTADFSGLNVSGNLTKLNDGFDTSLNPTWTMTVDGQTTNALDWDASNSEVQGSPLTGNGLEGLSNIDDVEVSGSGIASDPWVITFYSPPDPTNVSVTFAAGTDVLTKTQEGDPDPSPITKSQATDATSEPSEHGTYDDPPIQVVTTPLDTGADWSLLVNATGRYAGSQIVLNGVQPGQLYQASIRVRPTVDGTYTLVIRDEFENLIQNTSPRDVPLTAGSFQDLTVSDIEIPDGVNQVIMRVAVTDTDSAAWADFYVNWQGAEFREGQAATNVGTIMGHLLDDAQTDHASSPFARSTIDFVNKTFTNSLDTGGNTWTDAELSVSIPRGMTYRKVLDRIFGGLGYEWNLTPTVGTPGEWDLNIWNPDGRGTDHTSAATPSILSGQGTTWGSATRSLPSGNIIISEGGQNYSSRAASSDSYGTIGRREWYQADRSYSQTEVESWADKTLARFLDVSLKPRFEIADPPDDEWPVPVVDYGLADTLNVDFGEGKISREVEAISWRYENDAVTWGVHTGEAQFDAIHGAPSGSGLPSGPSGVAGSSGPSGAAVAPQRGAVALSGPVDEAVRRLLDEFDDLRPRARASAFVPSKGGGMFTIAVAASNASEQSKAKADFIFPGTPEGDRAMFNQVIDTINLITDEGRLILSEGHFFTDQALNSASGQIQGMGPRTTIITASAIGAFNSVFEMSRQGDIVRDLSILGGGVAVTMSGNDQLVENCQIGTSGDAGIKVFANGAVIDNCDFEATATAIDADGAGLNVTRCTTDNNDVTVFVDLGSQGSDSRIIGNGLALDGVAKILLGSTADNILIAHNFMEGGIEDSGSSVEGLIIAHNIWEGATVTAGHAVIDIAVSMFNVLIQGNVMVDVTGLVGIRTGSSDVVISGNDIQVCQIGIELNDANNCIVSGNWIKDAGQHAIRLHSTSNDNLISGNMIVRPSRDTANTYDGILVEGSDRNMISDNYISVPLGDIRFGINIADSDCDCSIVVGNRLGDPAAYGTDALNDSGIDTSLKYPDDPVYGDNFTECEPTPS